MIDRDIFQWFNPDTRAFELVERDSRFDKGLLNTYGVMTKVRQNPNGTLTARKGTLVFKSNVRLNRKKIAFVLFPDAEQFVYEIEPVAEQA